MNSALVIGIICIIMAVISSLRARGNEKERSWQRSLAIIFLVLGLILICVPLLARR